MRLSSGETTASAYSAYSERPSAPVLLTNAQTLSAPAADISLSRAKPCTSALSIGREQLVLEVVDRGAQGLSSARLRR